MPTEKYLNKIVLNKMTREQFENLDVKNPDEFYAITDKDSELNNPFSLLDYKFSEYELNNLSWLRSEGQYNSKAIHSAVYDLLLKIYNGAETKAGVSVKLTTETFTDYDFVLNTAEETFMLPTKVKLASGKAVVGNGIALGMTNGAETAAMCAADVNGYWGTLRTSGSGTAGTSIGTSLITTNSLFKNGTAVGITTDATISGIETSDSDLYLYFYVGETVQNANLINAGRIEEKVASLIPDNSSLIAGYAMPSNKYIDLTLGASGTQYTAPANGYFFVDKQRGSGDYILSYNFYTGITYFSTSSVYPGRLCIPCNKGNKIVIEYNLTGSTSTFKFVYAQGEV